MENQTTLSGSCIKVQITEYKHYENSVGNNLQSIQITTKCRYEMMRREQFRIFCKISIEEACKRHKIEIKILKVMNEHVHMIVDCPRTMSVAKLMQIIKGFSLGIYDQEIRKLGDYIFSKSNFSIPEDYRESKEILFYRSLGENMKEIVKRVRGNQKEPSKRLDELLQVLISDEEHKEMAEEGRRIIKETNSKVIEALKCRNISELEYPSQEVYRGLVEAVGNREKLSNAMMLYSKFFPNYQIKLIECAEETTDFDYVLQKLTGYLQLKGAIEQKIKSEN